MFADKHILNFVQNSINKGLDLVGTSVINTLGSTYAKAGNIFFINSKGESIGVLGSPFLHNKIKELSAIALQTNKSQLFESVPQDSSAGHGESKFLIQPFLNSNNYGALGLAVKNFNKTLARNIDDDSYFIIDNKQHTTLDGNIFLQTIQRPYSVLIFGSGVHVNSFIDMSNLMGWETTVVDTKYSEACLLNADTMIKLENISEFDKINLEPYNAAVILSHNPKTDDIYLDNLLKSHIDYIGMMGNKKNMQKTVAKFKLENSDRFFAPIGLDIGGNTHQAIALSICAQIEANRNKKI